MALPSSGAIGLSDVNVELGYPGSRTISLNDPLVRQLAGRGGSGFISMADLRGKSWIIDQTLILAGRRAMETDSKSVSYPELRGFSYNVGPRLTSAFTGMGNIGKKNFANRGVHAIYTVADWFYIEWDGHIDMWFPWNQIEVYTHGVGHRATLHRNTVARAEHSTVMVNSAGATHPISRLGWVITRDIIWDGYHHDIVMR